MKRKNRFISRLLLAFLLAAAVAHGQKDSSEEQKPASISGVVSNSLTGVPLAHARVILVSQTGAQACSLFQNTCRYVTTAVDGRFSINEIVPGQYQLVVERRGYGPLEDEQENWKTLELKPGKDITEVALELVPDAVIAGRVLDAKGVPVEHASVEAVGGGSPRFAVTDDHGEFRIGGLRAGRYLVITGSGVESKSGPPEIRTDGTAEINYAPTYYPSSPHARSATPVIARAGEETGGIEIKLSPMPILRVSGTVPDNPQDRVVAVSLRRGHMQERTTMVERDLTFTFWRVPPGRYQLFTEFCYGGGERVRSAPVEINVVNANVEGIHVRCAASLQLTGHVEVESGASLPDRKEPAPSLKLLPPGLGDYAELSGPISADGSIKVAKVSPGRYHVIGENLPQNLYVKSAHIGTVDLQDGILDLRNVDSKAVMTIQLSANGAEISGVVRDAKGPAAGAQVTLFFDDEYGYDVAATVPTGIDGSFVLHGIAPGKYKLVAYDRKSSTVVWSAEAMALHAPVSEDIDVQESDKIVRDLKLITSP
jgi:hypothetical protein